MKKIKISYIGGGSRNWARVFMNDLTVDGGLSGELSLYDIDKPAAVRNKKIGERLNNLPEAKSRWQYTVCETLEESLVGADFVVISILPGDFSHMYSDVHAPEKYGIYQSVGDTAGPGGVLRAMRTAPLFEEFALAVKEHCPSAWVINFTNPMSACMKALYGAFPGIKAFGCCHEVFGAQNFLCNVYNELIGQKPERHEITTDVYGVNHFTFITKARYKETDLLALLPEFMGKFPEGYYTNDSGKHRGVNYFSCRELVKLDFFRRYGALGAAGDRHLAEFVSGWYLGSRETARGFGFELTPVSYRIRKGEEQSAEADAMANGVTPVSLSKSGEEAVALIKAVCGLGTAVSNVNLPNMGQIASLPLNAIVETNCVFSADSVKPVVAAEPSVALANLVRRACDNVEALWDGIKNRDLRKLFAAFMGEPLCAGLGLKDGAELFAEMVNNTKEHLERYYNLDELRDIL